MGQLVTKNSVKNVKISPETNPIVIADLHLGDRKVLLSRKVFRGRDPVSNMTKSLIEIWNSFSDSRKLVFFVGDMVGDQDPLPWLGHLNGRILFTKGNHDHNNSLPVEHYIIYDGISFIFHHTQKYRRKNGEWLIHGHVHNRPYQYPFFDPKNKRINVAWDRVIVPVPLSLIVHLIRFHKEPVKSLRDLPSGILRHYYNGTHQYMEHFLKIYGKNS